MLRQRICRFTILFLTFAILAGCNFSLSTEESSPGDPGAIAARTLEFISTQVGVGTELFTEEAPITDNTTPIGDPTSAYLDSDCLNRAVFVEDITFRDNTQIETGASFVKIWRLRNDGTCIWNQSYSLAFMGGERMSAPTRSALTQVIQPGQTIDLSVNMVAPVLTGEYQGFWKLQSSTDQFFGIGSSGEQSFWVKINVTSSLTVTPTVFSTPFSTSTTPQPEETPTITITPSPTQEIHFQGSNSLTISQSIDLDNGEITAQDGNDLSLLGPTWEDSSLFPQNNAKLALYSGGSTAPAYSDCQNSPLTEEPIFITSLAVGDIICYSTDVGRYGFLTVDDLNSIFEFTLTTWRP